MFSINTIVKQNKKATKKKPVAKKASSKNKPLLIVYKGKNPLTASMLFICLPEDEEKMLKDVGEEMSNKEDYKRIVITEKDKSTEGWLLHVSATKPGLIL